MEVKIIRQEAVKRMQGQCIEMIIYVSIEPPKIMTGIVSEGMSVSSLQLSTEWRSKYIKMYKKQILSKLSKPEIF